MVSTPMDTKQASYSDGPQLRDFLKGQLCGTIPVLTPALISHPEVKDRTIIITGANTGLGFSAAEQLIEFGYTSRLILACRNLSKGQDAVDKLQRLESAKQVDIRLWQLDMASRRSIGAFADRASAELDRIDAVVLNAGVDLPRYEKAADEDGGYEMTLMVNVVSTIMLASLLVPVLRSKKPVHYIPRITIVGSAVQFMTKYQLLVDAATNTSGEGMLEWLSQETRWKDKIGEDRYYISKGMLQMMVQQLSQRVSHDPADESQTSVIINCVAPGLCKTDLVIRDDVPAVVRMGIKLLGREKEVGARSLVIGAVGNEADVKSHGQYLSEGVVKKSSSYFETSQGEEISKRMWEEISRDIELVRPGAVAAL